MSLRSTGKFVFNPEILTGKKMNTFPQKDSVLIFSPSNASIDVAENKNLVPTLDAFVENPEKNDVEDNDSAQKGQNINE